MAPISAPLGTTVGTFFTAAQASSVPVARNSAASGPVFGVSDGGAGNDSMAVA